MQKKQFFYFLRPYLNTNIDMSKFAQLKIYNTT